MPESLTRKKRRQPTARVAGFKSEWWPDLFRNGGRLQIGTPAGFTSEHPAGLNRNPQVMKMTDVVALIDAEAAKVPSLRGPYKKRDAVEISN